MNWTSTSLALLLLSCLAAPLHAQTEVQVGSKSFTESVILGEMVVLMGRESGVDVRFRPELGGSQVLFTAISNGEIDVYAEYTGTLRLELFGKITENGEQRLLTDDELNQRLAKRGIRMSQSLGFNNSYGLAVTKQLAAERGLKNISDLAQHTDLKYGISNEFKTRGDGWPGVKAAYRLQPQSLRAMQHSLAYESINNGSTQVIDVYTTDSHIARYDLVLLNDDRQYFPPYDAVYLYRTELGERAPEVVSAIEQLAGSITNAEMLDLNSRVDIDRVSEQRAAAEFLSSKFGLQVEFTDMNLAERLWQTTWEHLLLVAASLSLAIAVSVPLGVFAAKNRRWGQLLVGMVEVIQTIPGLALLVLIVSLLAAISLPAIGEWPVIIALFLYSLLPIVRNTMAGIENVPGSLLESAEAMGLPPAARLRLIELPLASPLIIAGIKTTAVINVGYAALGGLIGAGGYGEPIMSGLRLMDHLKMLEGAVPAAVLALLVKGGFTLLEQRVVPRGLRIAGE